jgi:ribosomal protein S18 acetylase RimI-like enzyme
MRMPTIRKALPEDCDAIAEHVRRLAIDIGVNVSPKVTAGDLRTHAFCEAPLLCLWVAEGDGQLSGSCISNFMFSTWRGMKGIYVIDLYVTPEMRGAKLGERLLRTAAREAWDKGARFIRLDVDHMNEGAARFYERAGFRPHDEDRTFALEPEQYAAFLGSTGN